MAQPVQRAFSIAELRRLAQRRIPRAVFDFIDGGAEDEHTLRDNMAAFGRVRLAPRVMVNVSEVDTRATVLGGPASLPLAISPTGAVGFGWRGGDLAIARAAAAAGIPYCLSTSATSSIEEIAAAAPGRLWFQAYFFRNREFTFGLIDRAQRAGYEALFVTADLPVGGKRERDFRNDFSVPFRYTAKNVLDFASRPAWALDMLFKGPPQLVNLEGLVDTGASTAKIASSVGRNHDAALDWEVLKRVRDTWKGKLLVKGILHPQDAERAVAAGCDGVVVSNHGGRQLDTALAPLDALPAVAKAVNGRASVLIDGGVRRGGDILKARALGAEAAMIGRATYYGVCAGGQPGAQRAIDILHDELIRSMQLCGVRSVKEIDATLLALQPA